MIITSSYRGWESAHPHYINLKIHLPFIILYKKEDYMSCKSSILNTLNKEALEELVRESHSLQEVLRKLRLSGRGHSHYTIKNRLIKENIDYKKLFKKRKKLEPQIFESTLIIRDTPTCSSRLKKNLIKYGYLKEICYECGLGPLWNDKKLVLQLDHINGNSCDDRIENLRLLCPNCHTQTDTYVGKGIKKESYYKRPRILCKSCGKEIFKNKNSLCLRCFNKKDKPKKFSISKEDLKKLVNELPTTKIAEKFGVSDTAIRKRCKKLGLLKISQGIGYWAKKYANVAK